ncbi:MAG: single-stranded DNA-binding protein [Chthoniobacterales bacterium]
MANLNKVQLIGNVTRDPEIKYTPKGSAVTDLGLAINRFFSGDNGEKREETTFVDVTLWGRQAEIAAEYCKKGRSIYVEGRLQLDSWEDKTSGQKRTRLRVVGENMQLLGPRPGAGNAPSHNEEDSSYRPSSKSTSAPRSQTSAPASPVESSDEEDDIPF